MATFGFPSDSYAQSDIRPGVEPAPPAPDRPEAAAGASAASLAAPHGQAVAWEAPVVTVLPVRATA